ncbi:hypothetical protein [Methylobacterium sp. ID0610]|uniref:hypothetical protein n=1 Tax=Methylobacterium carpenticola TaxID=3344827 RepID=UPI0036AA6900
MMRCELRSTAAPNVIITRKPTTPFRALPAASEVTFPGVFAWSAVTSASVTTALGVDPGAWNVWRNRRLTPAPLPPAWFRRTCGRPNYYLVSDVLMWLATRREEEFDTITAWRLGLLRDFGQDVSDPNEVRKLVRVFTQAGGPAGGVSFTPHGWTAYLDSLAAD